MPRAGLGLINLQNASNIADNESLLKVMLKDNPESAQMHFSLGNLYAKQTRWPEAQQAFLKHFHAVPIALNMR